MDNPNPPAISAPEKSALGFLGVPATTRFSVPTASPETQPPFGFTGLPLPADSPVRLRKDGQPDRRSVASRRNGAAGGCPIGTMKKLKTIYDPDQLAEAAAQTLLTKKATPGQSVDVIKVPKALGQVTASDRAVIMRITGETAEQFNVRLAEKLAVVSEKILARIEEKVDSDAFKPGELGFIFAVSEDKRARLDGRSQIAGATVNVQVNNYSQSGPSKEDIIRTLSGNFAKEVQLDPVITSQTQEGEHE